MSHLNVAILAGGLGTRLSEETVSRPKPMVEVGGRPMLWHIMSIYGAHGFRRFHIACGYKSEMIKAYFLHYRELQSDWEVDLRGGTPRVLGSDVPDWTVSLHDTGLHTMTGGRLRRLRPFLGGGTFLATYGDGVADVDLTALLAFHRQHGRLATVTAVHPPARFGSLRLEGGRVVEFAEKVPASEGWINGGFFVFEPAVLDYIDGDQSSLEAETLTRLADAGELCAFRHDGFWQPMDTLRERHQLEEMWSQGRAPWRVWA